MKSDLKKMPKKKNEVKEEKQIEKLASCGLTNIEIADTFGYDENTLKRNFEIFLIKGRFNLKERLKRKQISVAMQGNVTMLIWLGKQYLGQAEKIEESGDYNVKIERTEVK